MSTKHNGASSIEIDGEKYATTAFDYDGTHYVIRELSVDEGDDIAEAAATPEKDPKTGQPIINNRLNTRLLLAKALVEPVTTVDQIGKFGGRKFGLVLRHFNEVNSLPEENPTPLAG